MKLILLFSVFSLGCYAQNTISLSENGISPKAKLTEIVWMEGHWKGKAFGGITEEIWGPPLGGSMLFSFKLVVENKIIFMNLGHIRQLGETLVFELKHFNNDLKGWEEKNEVQSFKFVKSDANRFYFDGFTFEKISSDEMNIYGLIHQDNGTAKEIMFNYKKNYISNN